MTKSNKNCLVICGPSASGKTRLAVQLALILNGEIISVDSRQVYRGMDLGTGKDRDEYITPQGTVPVHLIDIVGPGKIYTLFHFQHDCYQAIEAVRLHGRLPLLCGGTGLYLEAVLKHYDIPNIPEDRDLRNELDHKDKDTLIYELQRIAPDVLARTDTSSKKRTIRALEIAYHRSCTGVKSREQRLPNPELKPLIIGLNPELEKLRTRIKARLLERLELGMVREVEQLIESGISPERVTMFGMEYRFIALYLKRELSFEQMVEQLFRAICQLAKRQQTYFRGMERRGSSINWLETPDCDQALALIDELAPDWL